jgi:hypothetical protein
MWWLHASDVAFWASQSDPAIEVITGGNTVILLDQPSADRQGFAHDLCRRLSAYLTVDAWLIVNHDFASQVSLRLNRDV